MARTRNRLTVRFLETVKEPGIFADGGELYLSNVRGAKRWIFVYRWQGKRRELGLGTYPEVSLPLARKLSASARDQVAAGVNPVEARREKRTQAKAVAQATLTFGAFAESYIASIETGWKNDVHRQQWRNSLRDHAGALKDKPIADIGTDDVLAVLRPIWLEKGETASRVRGRIEKVIAAAKALGHFPKDVGNPASWRGHLDVLLPKRTRLQRGHHPALSHVDAPTFMTKLRARPALAGRALEFAILTAARSGEVLGATWGEIDFKERLWLLPRARMKAAVEHEVPLSHAAIALLEKLKPEQPGPGEIIFAVNGATRSNMAMSMLLRRMGYGDITVHGFRSTFRQWTRTCRYPEELCEEALSHIVGGRARNAYARGSMAEPRRYIMDAWAEFLAGAENSLMDVAA